MTPALGFVNAVGSFLRERADSIVILVGFFLILSFIELRLRRLFDNHEKREEQMHASSALMGETAAALARDVARQIKELQLEAAGVKLDIENLGALVRLHELRLATVEDRITRAALLVPSPRRPPEPA